MPILFIEEFVGIANRLETLPLAFALQQEFGHDIVLDWRELTWLELGQAGDGGWL